MDKDPNQPKFYRPITLLSSFEKFSECDIPKNSVKPSAQKYEKKNLPFLRPTPYLYNFSNSLAHQTHIARHKCK